MQLKFDPEPAAELSRLYDTAPEALSDRIDAVLDLLEENPGHPEVRRRRFHNPPYWVVTVTWRSYDLLILWELNDEGVVVIRYLGPTF